MEPPKLTWSDGVPLAQAFDDPYYSKVDGYEETCYTFLAGNGLPERFRDGFCIAELGFGTGLSAAVAWAAHKAQEGCGALRFVSFEAFLMAPDDMAKALKPFHGITAEASALVALVASGERRLLAGDFSLEIVTGDARASVPNWSGSADAWFLDGFSPAKNPELWDADLMQKVGTKTRPGGTFATYTAAGHVRRKLSAAGFDVRRVKGFGTKRHMSVGTLLPK